MPNIDKAEIVKANSRSASDTGSPDVQVALLTEVRRHTMAANVSVAWFGNVRGLDAYGDVAGILIVGRWGLKPNEAGEIAGILSGRAVDRIDGWYPSGTVTIKAVDGTVRTYFCDVCGTLDVLVPLAEQRLGADQGTG